MVVSIAADTESGSLMSQSMSPPLTSHTTTCVARCAQSVDHRAADAGASPVTTACGHCGGSDQLDADTVRRVDARPSPPSSRRARASRSGAPRRRSRGRPAWPACASTSRCKDSRKNPNRGTSVGGGAAPRPVEQNQFDDARRPASPGRRGRSTADCRSPPRTGSASRR